jgi:hypothetical protein
VTINSAGQHARVLKVAPTAGDNGQVMLSSGWIDIAERLEVGNAGQFIQTGGQLLVPDVQLSGNGLLKLSPGGNKTLRLSTISTANSASLDLTDNRLIVTDMPLGSWTGTQYTGVTGLIASGRNGGAWNGSGISTSQTLATTSDYTTLAVATADELGRIGGTFGGIPLDSGDVLVMYTYGGDANLSGNVDIDDYGQIDFNSSLGGTLPGWFNGDFDYSGSVDVDDYGIIDFVIGIQGPPLAATLRVASIPEPACAMLVAGGLLFRRRRARSG